MEDVLKKTGAGFLGGMAEACFFSPKFILRNSCKYALRFGNNAWLALHLSSNQETLTNSQLLLAGFLTGAIEAVFFHSKKIGIFYQITKTGTQQASMFFFKTHLDDMLPCPEKSAWQSMMVGAAAAVPGICLTKPLDVLQKRLVADHQTPIRQIFVQILAKNGPRGVFKGLGAQLFRKASGMGITWAVVDAALAFARSNTE